ncbi:hypothetical protein GKZ67_07700 [Hymenobacter sp. BRD67]|nr:hypothetical protein GKZ67_07700 [Hymenobacter sp. BRD67]
MVIALLPVIEIGYNNHGIEVPTQYPYWENSALWDAYHAACYAAAGFKDEFCPYLPGSSFYQLSAITARNLIKLTKDHTAELRAGTHAREKACAFFGGYVLRIDNEDVFFPQCCGQLSDIAYWEGLAAGVASTYEGHPAPVLSFAADTVQLDFLESEFDESFQPPLPMLSVEICRPALQLAIKQANLELELFAQRLRELNEAEALGIPDIDKLLIWEDGKHA